MKKKKIAKAAAAAFIATSLTATVVPVYADDSTADDVTKDESVYTVLNADGSVSEITVSDILHSDDGFDNYTDESDLKDVENLKSNDPVKTTSGGYTWTTKNKDVYYQGTSTKDLPLDVDITYTLDGEEMSAADMLGKSGHVQIKINVKNKESQDYTVNGKTYHLATPFVTVAGAYMDQDKFSNVKINAGTVQSDSSHDIAAAVMIPGLRDGLKDVLDTDTFKTLDSYLIDDVTIDADVKKFESPAIMLAAATNTDALKDEMKDAKLTDVFDDLDKLQEATDKLQSGAQSLYDGADQLNSGASALNNGVSTLQNGINKLTSGANQLSSGAATLYNGASQVSQGAASLQSGLGQLSANSAALNSGADQIASGILSMANKVLDSNDATKNLPDLTMSNYADVLGAISGAAATRNATLQQVASQAGQSTDITKDLIYMAATANPNTKWTADSLASAMTAQGTRMTAAQKVQNMVGSVNSKADALKNQKVQTLLAGVKQQAQQNVPAATDAQMNQVYAGIAAEVTAPMAKLGQNVSPDQANAIVAATLHQIVANGQTPNADTLNTSLNTLAAQLQTQNPQVLQAQMTQAIKTYGNDQYKNDPFYDAFAKGVYEQQYQATVTAMTADQFYDQVATQVKASSPNLDDATVAKLITYTAENYDTKKDLATQLGTSGAALTDAANVATAMTNAATADGNVAVSGVLDSLFTASDENKDIQSLETSLTGVKSFTEGLKTYTAGVDSAYAGAKVLSSGASQVTSGAKSLSAGASQLKDGINQLSSGAATLKSGSDALANGTTQLKSGAKTLLDGMKQYNDEAISKLTKNDKISDLKDAADLLDQVKKDGKSYDNYSGISEGTDGTVKFVYKVEGVKEEKKNTVKDSDKKDNRTFFQRVADLFKF